MAITFEQIQKANEGLTGIDVKGKNYIMVPQRVKAFRMLYPDGFIHTNLLSIENGVCVMQTKVGYYTEDGKEVVLGTGMAYEKETNGYINKTSYIENCETSAVGRALGFLGLGIDGGGICSAEELANAINNQNKPDFPKTVNNSYEAPKARKDSPAEVVESAKIPEQKPKNPVQEYIANEISFMKQMFGIPDTGEMNKKFMEMRKALIEAKIIEDVQSDKQTMDQAKQMIEAIYKNFNTNGEQK